LRSEPKGSLVGDGLGFGVFQETLIAVPARRRRATAMPALVLVLTTAALRLRRETAVEISNTNEILVHIGDAMREPALGVSGLIT
jgi:hypothetical protein